jgi:phenylacetate-coenzyme A ligase PaaK-like adenylate-forming protein
MTNGSSGKPFSVLRTPEENSRSARCVSWRRPGLARPWHSAALLHDASFTGPRLLPGRVGARVGLFRLRHLDPMRSREELAAELIRLSPDVVSGYASVVAHVASSVGERGRAGAHDACLRAVRCSAPPRGERSRPVLEPLPPTSGAAELNLLAHDCPRGAGTMHVCDEGLILEVICDGRPAQVGEAGSVVATALHSHAMPFIRYETGDRAIRGPDPARAGGGARRCSQSRGASSRPFGSQGGGGFTRWPSSRRSPDPSRVGR